MFSRVLKSQTDKFLSSSSTTASSSNSNASTDKSSSSQLRPFKSSAASCTSGTASPSKIPLPSTPVGKSERDQVHAKENQSKYSKDGERGSAQSGWTGYVTTSQQQGGHGHDSHAVPPSPSRTSYQSSAPAHGQAAAHNVIRSPMPPPPTSAVHSRDCYDAPSVNPDADIHMQTVNPAALGPEVLAQLRNPAPTTTKTVEDRDIKMQTVNRGAIPPSIQASLKDHRGDERQSKPLPQSPAQAARSYIPTRAAPSPAQNQQVAPPTQLQLWEREILASGEVKRKATLAQLYFLDYYFDLLGYLHSRKGRLQGFKADTAARKISTEEYQKEFASYCGRERVVLRKRRTKLRVDQFRIIAQVGQGGYGSVYLARKADTGQVCALKKMKKTTLAKMDEVKHVLVERDILTATKTPWLVRLLYAFQDRDHVYLAMEYVPGGDFRTLLNNSGVLKEEHARFYSAEMFAGVNELHKLGYIHRDLKPENFLVAGDGHVKLTDFGLATGALNPMKIESMKHKLDQVKDENLVFRSTLERRTLYKSMRMAEPRYADSVVGSPDYMPPEVLRGRTYTFSADYWSLGCILFEFLCGFPPFSGGSPEETWANLKNWTKVLRRPVYDKPEDLIFNLTDPAWDAITRLIAHPKDRVSTLHEVQSLPFFNRLPFSQLREIPAPFVPMLESDSDVGYFDSFDSPEDMAKYAEVFKKQADVDAVAEKGLGSRSAWIGFTFGRNANIQLPPAGRKPEGEALQTMF